MQPTFVFFHIGHDPKVELMVRSVLLTNPGAPIIQCSDPETAQVPGVSKVFRLEADPSNLMTYRLLCFSELNFCSAAVYLDTDMLLLRQFSFEHLVGDADVACCQRVFGNDKPLNTSFKGMNLSEYEGRTVGEVYPIIACFTATRSPRFWQECLLNLKSLDPKFHFWYGDQEAMRNVASMGRFKIRYLPESQVACLPEFANAGNPPIGLHFKGPARKDWMTPAFNKLFQPKI